MSEYIALDCHKRYTLGEREDRQTGQARQRRIEHRPGAIRSYLAGATPGSAVALEAMGSWYWIVNEIEEAGMVPLLVHPRKAKLMMGMIDKSDKLDVHGLNRLQRCGTLPTVWVPPASLRDLRELTRGRLVLCRQRTRLKNRLLATLAKHGLSVEGFADAFGKGARAELERRIAALPQHTAWLAGLLLEQLDLAQRQLREQERRLAGLLAATPELTRLASLPGVGTILAATILYEVGDAGRFASAERLAAYAGCTPRVISSGGKTRHGTLRPDVNRYLKWALCEAANAAALHHRRHPDRHVSRLYARLRERKGHAKAIGAVARHLAEAVFHMLRRAEDYKDPSLEAGRAKGGVSAALS